jgi:hypothetical protein
LGYLWECSRGHFLHHLQLWFGKDRSMAGAKADNTVTLSPAFWTELSSHPISADTEVVRALANQEAPKS